MSIAGIQWAYGVEGLSAPARAVLVARAYRLRLDDVLNLLVAR